MENRIIEYMEEQSKRLTKIESLLSLSKTVLDLNEVSQMTGLSKSHIYKLTSQSKIPHYKQSKHLYFDRVEIENWLKSTKHFTVSEIEKQASTYIMRKPGSRA